MKYLIWGLIALNIIILGVFFVNLNPEVGSNVSNIRLDEGAIFVGNSDNYAEGDLTPTLGSTLRVTGAATFDSTITAADAIRGDKAITAKAATSIYSTTTLVATDSGKVYTISASGTTITLPAVTSTGATFTFIIGGAVTDGNVAITSAEGDNIEGSVIVAGAVVDCDDADVLTFVADGENIGDFVTVVSNGTDWIPLESGALTGSKLTCSG